MNKQLDIKRKLIIAFIPLAVSFAFKNLFTVGTTISLLPYYAAAYGAELTDMGGAANIIYRLFVGAFTAAGGYIVITGLHFLLERNGRAFMPREEFIFGISVYVIIANIITGAIGLLYYLQPIIGVFASDIVAFTVNSAVFFVMFNKMRARIPDFMVARVFGTLVIPYMAYQLTLFI